MLPKIFSTKSWRSQLSNALSIITFRQKLIEHHLESLRSKNMLIFDLKGAICNIWCVTKHRITTPFTFACTYGPKHVSNIIFECFHNIKKFWGEPKGTRSDLQNYNFLDTSSWFSFLKWFSIHYLSISLSGDVFAIKNCAVHRLMMPLHSTRA